MIKWRDINVVKPTETDADENRQIMVLCGNGVVAVRGFMNLDYVAAWAPLSELPNFKSAPEPIEGYRYVDTKTEKPQAAKYFDHSKNIWIDRSYPDSHWCSENVYIVPIEAPKAKDLLTPEEAFKTIKVVWPEAEQIRNSINCFDVLVDNKWILGGKVKIDWPVGTDRWPIQQYREPEIKADHGKDVEFSKNQKDWHKDMLCGYLCVVSEEKKWIDTAGVAWKYCRIKVS